VSDVPRLDIDQVVNSAVDYFENRPDSTPVPSSIRKQLIEHTADAHDEILKRIRMGTLTETGLVDGIVTLLWRADQEQRLQQRPRGDLLTEPLPRPLSYHYVVLAMAKDCPVFPYCVDAHRCIH
jgi:hypothetical protein